MLAGLFLIQSAHSWHNSIHEREWNYGLEPTILCDQNSKAKTDAKERALGSLIILRRISEVEPDLLAQSTIWKLLQKGVQRLIRVAALFKPKDLYSTPPNLIRK